MESHDATIHHVVIQAIGRIGELEALLEKTDSDSERRITTSSNRLVEAGYSGPHILDHRRPR